MNTSRIAASLAVVTALACTDDGPTAGRVTDDNAADILPAAEALGGRVGDYYLKNDHATFVIQGPGREQNLGAFGGNLIDAALPGKMDRFGEIFTAFALGRTIEVDRMWARRDDGETAVIKIEGRDALNTSLNLEAIAPDLVVFNEDGSGTLGHDPEAPLFIGVDVRYELPADEARLTVEYEITNNRAERLELPIGFFIDKRGDFEQFQPGAGFGSDLAKSFSSANIQSFFTLERTSEMAVLIADEHAMGIIPRHIADKTPPRAIILSVPTVGTVIALEVRNVLDAAKGSSMTLEPSETKTMSYDVVLADTADQVLSRGWELLGVDQGAVSGCVTTAGGGPASKVRVGLTHSERGVVGTFTTGDDGCFSGRVPTGSYTAIAGAPYRPTSAEVSLTVPGSVNLTLSDLGSVRVNVAVFNRVDALSPEDAPCRVTLVGARPPEVEVTIGDSPIDDPGGIIARMKYIRTCRGTFDMIPGRYLAIVTRGPEFDKLERVINVTPGGMADVSGDIHRVVESHGYAASDFHIHSIYSSDTATPAHDRVLSMATEGLDFWASTDHDVVVDFTKHIAELGLERHLLTMPGAEVTTFDAGHFGAYPLPEYKDQSNGGSPMWSWDPTVDRRPTMGELFNRMRQEGAMIQVNHPRSGGASLGAYFTRAAMSFDPVTFEPFADIPAQELSNSVLRYPEGLDYFSADFDIIEVLNGINTWVSNESPNPGMVYATGVEDVGHDWMNLLSSGRKVIGVGNSDTHTLDNLPGEPRTMLGGHDGGLPGLINALRRGDAIMTDGPMVRVELRDNAGNAAGIGQTLTPVGNRVMLSVRVETPAWYDVNRVEVIANVFFGDPTSGGVPPRAIPLAELTSVVFNRPNGGQARFSTVELPIDLSMPPFDGADSWLAVRVGGTDTHVWPTQLRGGGTVDLDATTPETFLSNRSGVHPYAMTNPIYIDMDGDGRWRDLP